MQREIPIEHERPIVKSATDARQGVTHTGLRWVLGGGLILAGIAFVMMMMMH
jgi:hypothetical protein